jgi:hypothetical protein
MRALAYFAAFGAKYAPSDIRAQFFAPHLPPGQSLDCRAMFSRDTPAGVLPLPDGSLRDLQRNSERRLRAHDSRRTFNWMFHVQHSREKQREV